jgi:hypothetical protein
MYTFNCHDDKDQAVSREELGELKVRLWRKGYGVGEGRN